MKKLEALSAKDLKANEAFGCWLCREPATHRGIYRLGFLRRVVIERLLCATHATRFAQRQGIDIPKVMELQR